MLACLGSAFSALCPFSLLAIQCGLMNSKRISRDQHENNTADVAPKVPVRAFAYAIALELSELG